MNQGMKERDCCPPNPAQQGLTQTWEMLAGTEKEISEEVGEELSGLKRLSCPGAQTQQRLFQMGRVRRKSRFPYLPPPHLRTNKRPA